LRGCSATEKQCRYRQGNFRKGFLRMIDKVFLAGRIEPFLKLPSLTLGFLRLFE
jgi:hypothetical protein